MLNNSDFTLRKYKGSVMKFENILRNFSPKSFSLDEFTHSTSPSKMTNSDIMAAMGMIERQAKFGLLAFLAKNDISEQDKFTTIEELTLYALKIAPKLVRKAAGNKLDHCVLLLARMAFEDYARSAGTIRICPNCCGKGLIDNIKSAVKVPEIITFNSNKSIEPNIHHESASKLCQRCNGKGITTYRCRCKGRGKIVDKKQTLEQGVGVMKNCPYCAGRGYKRIPSAVAFNMIKHLIPELTQSSWSRNWKLFYQKLVDKCYIEEAIAEQAFSKVTE